MLQRPQVPPSRVLLLSFVAVGFVVAFLTTPLSSQTAVPDENGRLVFKANVRTVLLNVVVTGHDGKPVQGLHKEDFQVGEDGHSQAITFFEEHSGAHPLPMSEADLPPLPPDVFTNIPRVPPSDAVTVLLLDSMNTQLQDQSFVHAQMLKYLKNIPPGTRMAIFTLGNSLGYIQGFTDDASLLSAALSNPKLGAGPVSSPLLLSQSEKAANQQLPAQIQQAATETASPAAAASLAALKQFMAEQAASQNDLRTKTTFEAFQQLAGYLAGIPGRKNVIWFSSAFPLVLFPNPELTDAFAVGRDYLREVRKTDAMLAAAQVAVYPVAAEGLAGDSVYDASYQPVGVTSAQQAGAQIGKQLRDDAKQRNADHTTMEEIAKNTGGAAYINTNGLSGAVAHVIDQGSYFYTITYTPTNTATDGKFRKIQVRLAHEDSGDKLAYRRGYYAADTKEAKAETAKPAGGPLHPFMGPGMPNSTQIPLALRIRRVAAQPGAGAPGDAPPLHARNQTLPSKPAGDNANLKAPLTRYRVDFVIAASGLQLDPAADGSRHGKLEVTLLAYSREGQALNWMVKTLDLDMDAARFAQVKANGVNFSLDIDVPNGGVTLRSGVFDLNTNLAGTLEIPLSSVTGPAQNSHL
jgi:VWFA-related protein